MKDGERHSRRENRYANVMDLPTVCTSSKCYDDDDLTTALQSVEVQFSHSFWVIMIWMKMKSKRNLGLQDSNR
jgi:hypothetical protein